MQVFDSTGAYLTSMGGNWTSTSGGLRGPSGVAVDNTGNVYVTDRDNHRIQKFAPGVLGWTQVNINGFGDRWAGGIQALAPFAGRLHASSVHENAPTLWRLNADDSWTAVVTGGFGGEGYYIDDLVEFSGKFYASTAHFVCDDPSCNTYHSDGGQVWRSPDGANWNLVVDAGFGDPTNYEIFRFVVFRDQLYASTWNWDFVAGASQGSEIWRTSTGNPGSWTRVADGGFGDVGNQVVLTFAEHNGALYAGTRNTATGGEVWRSSDGASWSKVNADGFGSADTREVGSLAMFGGALYAGTYNRTTGAQLWRCTLCDGSDWSQMVADGFGDVQNRRVAALAVLRGRLYAATNNWASSGGDGMQVWRSTDGQQWEKVAPDGYGDSNNTGPYWGNSVTVFENRLYAGTGDGANGGEIWQKTITADFTASPTTGRPPLVVSFTNTSAGDFISSLWDFGDGQTSTATNPTHTYTQSGAYTVRLTVSDGVDSHTLTRPAYVDAWYRTYLPLSFKGYDPTLYDGFDNPAYDGAWNPRLWSFGGESAFQARQESETMVFTNSPFPQLGGADLTMLQPPLRSLPQIQQFLARLKISSDRSGGWSSVQIFISSDDLSGHGWFSQCFVGGSPTYSQATFGCEVAVQQGSSYPREYRVYSDINYGTWYTAKIEINRDTASMRFFLDNTLLGTHTPTDTAALRTASNLRTSISLWNGGANATSTRYVDYVRITPAQ